MQPRMQTKYREVVLPQLQKEFEYGNVMQVPALEKIVVNTCLKDAITNQKILDVVAEIGLITGQKPVITRLEVHRELQTSRRYAGREGDLRSADVGVHRPPACSRDPRTETSVV